MATMIGELIGILRHQYSSLPLYATAESCAGKTFIVTGANSGLGYEAAKHLVRLHSHRVILAVRSAERGATALKAIEAETGVCGVGQVWQLDLSSYQSTLDFADRVKQDLERVDGIIQNATAANGEWILAEGWESTIMVNILGTILLAVLLMPYLEQCGKKFNMQPKISLVTSGLGFTRQADLSKINRSDILRDVNDSEKWSIDGTNRYSLSKLLQIFACRQLALLAPSSQSNVIINIVSPGFCKTGLVRYSDPGTQRQVAIMQAVMGRSAEWGSRNLLHGISVGEESHGKYMTYCKIREHMVPEWVSSKDGQLWGEQIWAEVAAEIERVRPGCVGQALKA